MAKNIAKAVIIKLIIVFMKEPWLIVTAPAVLAAAREV
jgi:hypothetical protein